MRLKQYINEKMTHQMTHRMQKIIGNDLLKLLKPDYFKKIPLQQIFNIFDKHGLIPLAKDNTKWKGSVSGNKKSEEITFDLGVKAFEENGTYPKIPDASLILTYKKIESGKYEVIVNIG